MHLISIIKEVAGESSGIEDDEKLGVRKFQEKYFKDFPVYLNQSKEFYHALGGRSLLSQPLFSWNPFELWSRWTSLQKRLADRKISGALHTLQLQHAL